MKEVIRLNAFELGQILGACDVSKLSPALQFKIKRVQAKIYLASGFSRKEVFGDTRVTENKKLAQSVKDTNP